MANQFEDLNDLMDTATTVALNSLGHVQQVVNINLDAPVPKATALIQDFNLAKNSEYEADVNSEPSAPKPSR